LEEHFPSKVKVKCRKSSSATIADDDLPNEMPVSEHESSDARLVYDEPDLVEESIKEIKLIESKAAAAAEFGRKNKICKEEQDEWGIIRVEIETKKGKWLEERFPKGGNRKSNLPSGSLIDEGITFKESSNARLVYDEPDLVKESIEEIKLIESKAADAAEFGK
jgi:hypothetical protein